MSIIEQCIPRKVLPKRRKLTWVNAGIRHAIQKRNYLYRKSKCNPDFRAKYKQQRNKVGSAKRSFIVTIPTGNTKEFWRAIKLLNGKGSQTIPVINHDGRQLVSDQQKADALNYFFHSCFNTTLPPLSEEGNSLVLDPAACPEELYCSEQEVYELLTNLDHKKASGPDGISARMLKGTATSIAPVLTMLFNRLGRYQISCLFPKDQVVMNHATTDQFPCYPLLAKCWKESYIIELLPTWNVSIHQYKINGGSYLGDRPQVLFSLQRMTGLLF